jgi:5'-3' exonuclease
MGVKGLWQLLLPIGRRISIESLEGKILAIDASIWLTQFIKAMRDPETGSVKPAAHLIGFFRRLCKLRYQMIRPVFVFDGAAPEIKQRELAQRRKRRDALFQSDASSGGGDSLQRMAKRILVQQLKNRGTIKLVQAKEPPTAIDAKSGTATASSSFAPGFYDPEAGEQDQDAPIQEEGRISGEREVVDLLNDDDYLKETPAQAQSDWDAVVAVEENEKGTNDTDENKDNNNNNNNNVETTDHHRAFSVSHNGFDVDYVASLPSIQRKDVIENARRQQRMQSRQEFMSVAANPQEFGSCQLRNFLRSTKLNKNIVQMAKQVVKKEGNDDTLASDRSRRIVFEKDDDVKQQKEPSKGKLERLSRISKKRKISLVASSSDSDDDVEWEDADAGDELKAATALATTKRRAIVDVDSDDAAGGFFSTPNPFSPVDAGGGFFLNKAAATTTARSTRENIRRVIDVGDDDSDGDAGGGGFLPSTSTAPATQNAQELQDYILARAIQQDEDSDQEHNDEVLARKLQNYEEAASDEGEYPDHLDENNTHPMGNSMGAVAATSNNVASLPTTSDSVETNQVDEDERLARALQESEAAYSSKKHSAINISNSGEDLDRKQKARQSYLGSNKDDNMDESFHHEAVSTANGTNHTGGLARDNDLGVADNKGTKEPTHVKKVTIVDVAGIAESEEEDEDVDWEDGGGDAEPGDDREMVYQEDLEQPENDAHFESFSKAANQTSIAKSASASASPPPQDFDEDFENTVDSEVNNMGFGESDPWVDDFKPKASSDTSTAAALKHAQVTAATLTDWAGRAFRRAIAVHTAETGTSIAPTTSAKDSAVMATTPYKSKQSVIDIDDDDNDKEEDVPMEGSKNSNNDNKQDAALDDEAVKVSSPFHAKRASAGSVAKNASTASSGVAAAWPETLGGDAALETLEQYKEQWAEERKKQERDMDTVTDEMRAEVIQLLELFGVPYVQAPAEAEAQCVALEKLGLVDGVVTEDSDAFVFGGKTIYKHIFDDQKYVEVYRAEDAEREMNLTHDGMVALAMLLGGDYTEGVKGVGVVNGIEVVDAFDISKDVKKGLQDFRKWLDGFDPADALATKKGKSEQSKENVFHKNHHTARTRWIAPKHFPDDKVLSAYLNPVVDKSEERFTFGVPDLDNLILFCNQHVGWSPDETRRLLSPVVKKVESGSVQTRIDSFMRYEDGIKFANVRSKRLREVLDGVQKRNSKKNKGEG